jgi:hypothetical protein
VLRKEKKCKIALWNFLLLMWFTYALSASSLFILTLHWVIYKLVFLQMPCSFLWAWDCWLWLAVFLEVGINSGANIAWSLMASTFLFSNCLVFLQAWNCWLWFAVCFLRLVLTVVPTFHEQLLITELAHGLCSALQQLPSSLFSMWLWLATCSWGWNWQCANIAETVIH